MGACLLICVVSSLWRLSQHTAAYDTAISTWMAAQVETDAAPWLDAVPLRQTLRYGENPHQQARWYSQPKQGWGGALQLQGKELSTNNLLDLEAALATVREFGFGGWSPPCSATSGCGGEAHQSLRSGCG